MQGTAKIGLAGGKGIEANSPLFMNPIFRSDLNTSLTTTKADLDVYHAQDIIVCLT